jgi:PAS domain S-box-containing protein
MIDPVGRVMSWNPGAERIKGWNAKQIIGRTIGEFYTPSDRDDGRPEENLEIARLHGRFEGEGWRVRRDGSRFWAVVVIDAIRDPEGKLIGFAKVTRDATERKNREIELDEAKTQLFEAQKAEVVGRLTAGVAHDFNNLLMVLQGSIEMARRKLSHDPGKALMMLGRAEESVKRGTLLVSQLLAFSRQARLEPSVVQIDLVALEPLLHSTLDGHLKLRIEQEDPIWWTQVDLVQLHNALLHLCINARDAMPNGGTVLLGLQNLAITKGFDGIPPGDYVHVLVSDSGTGMSKDVLDRAFEPFFTTKGPRVSGLGLSQVQGFVRQSQGHVVLSSVVGQGAAVSIYLPRVAEPEA